MSSAVSVVIPCFNLGAYLDEAVQSVLDQTYRDFEILIVDDGSDDAVTKHLLVSYQRPRTRIIRTSNGGVSRARNIGLAEAQGRYVSFLDADDVLEPRFLEKTVARLEQDATLAFASCWLSAFGEQDFEWMPQRCDLPWVLAEDTVCTAAPIRREALQAVGGFDETRHLDGYEDWDLAISLLKQGFRGAIVPEILFRYRIRAGSKWANRGQASNYALAFGYLLDKHADCYAQFHAAVMRAIEQRLGDVERQFSGPVPPRPRGRTRSFSLGLLTRRTWRQEILELELHRRRLEAELEAANTPSGHDTGGVEWGSFKRRDPISRVWGLDRGLPIDRYYIARFLADRTDDLIGHVLEVKDPVYTHRFGSRAHSVTVVDVSERNPEATLRTDLSQPESLPKRRFDCIVLTQTIQFVFDLPTTIGNLHKALAPGGILLGTMPCVSRIDYESGVDGDFWRFTPASARRLFESCFDSEDVQVTTFGNVLTCTAFLQGLAAEDLDIADLEATDRYFPLLVAVRAVKPDLDTPSVREPPALEGHVDAVTCSEVVGWAWDPAAPERRLHVEVWSEGQRIGAAWADQPRPDLAEAGKVDGRLGFSFRPEKPLHGESPPEITVLAAGTDAALDGTPQPAVCTCEPGNVIAGFALDGTDSDGRGPTFPRVDVVGWAVGATAPVEQVELLVQDEVFRRVPVSLSRPDIAEAFPDVEWAARAGFAARVSLAGAAGCAEIALRGVLADGTRVPLQTITAQGAGTPALPVIAVVEPAAIQRLDPPSILCQDAAFARVEVVAQAGDWPHPGFSSIPDWSATSQDPNVLLWLADGSELVNGSFVARAASELALGFRGSFAVAVAEPSRSSERTLARVLSGDGLGAALMFHGKAAAVVGGIDATAPGAAAAQWDLAVRLVAAGHEWVEVVAASPDAPSLGERAGPDVARWLYRKHSSLYERHLRELVLAKEAVVGELLRASHLEERALDISRTQLRARRRERDRLGAKLRRAASPQDVRKGEADPDWGDFRRLEPVSPSWGEERGLCIDRYYIERFLQQHAADIRGEVLAVRDSIYVDRYGGEDVVGCDVVDIDRTNPEATVTADLRSPDALSDQGYDCIILMQELSLVDDPLAVILTCRRILKPGGVLLLSVSAVARMDPEQPSTDHWRFSELGLHGLLAQAFPTEAIAVSGHGSRRATLAFLVGLAADEVDEEVLETEVPGGHLVITARAVSPGGETG